MACVKPTVTQTAYLKPRYNRYGVIGLFQLSFKATPKSAACDAVILPFSICGTVFNWL